MNFSGSFAIYIGELLSDYPMRRQALVRLLLFALPARATLGPSYEMGKPMTPKVCILNEDDARSLTYGALPTNARAGATIIIQRPKWKR